ncbi:MAG: hypothetical protein WC052_06000 [Patescibacteria group bacterium]
MFKFDYTELEKFLPGSFMPTDEVLTRIEQYMNEAHTHTLPVLPEAPEHVFLNPSKFRKLTYADMVEAAGKYVLQKQVWIPIDGSKFSNSWYSAEATWALSEEVRADHASKGVKLVRYECENDANFEFNNCMRLP